MGQLPDSWSIFIVLFDKLSWGSRDKSGLFSHDWDCISFPCVFKVKCSSKISRFIIRVLSTKSIKDYWIPAPDSAEVYLYVTEWRRQKSISYFSGTILGFSPDSTKSILLAITILQNFPVDLFSIYRNQPSKLRNDSESVKSNIITAPWHFR